MGYKKNSSGCFTFSFFELCWHFSASFHVILFKFFSFPGSAASSSDKSAKQSAKEPSSSSASTKLKRAGPKDEDPSDKKKAKKDDQAKMASVDESNSGQ